MLFHQFRTRLLVASAALAAAAVTVSPSRADVQGVDIHGFASQGYMNSTAFNYLSSSVEGSWAYSEYAMNVSSTLADNLRVGVQMFARDLGELGNLKLTLDWAFGDYHYCDALGLRAGRVKMPYGFYNETADFDGVRTAVLLPQSVYDLRLRDLLVAVNGVNPYGSHSFGSLGSFDYSAYFGTQGVPADGSVARFFNDSGRFSFVDLHNTQAIGGGLAWNTPLDGLRLGHTVNHYRGDVNLMLGDGLYAALSPYGAAQLQHFTFPDIRFNVTSTEYTRGNMVLSSEYSRWIGDFNNPYVTIPLNSERWYGQGSYRLNALVEVGSYYSVYYDDKDDKEGKATTPDYVAWQKDLAVSMRFDLSPNMIFKLEGHYMDGVAQVFLAENPGLTTNPSGLDRNWWMFVSKLSFVF